MIDVIRQQLTEKMPQEEKMHRTREFLQILCLKFLDEKKWFDSLAFVGGTALRILFDLRRFSEDLDFSLLPRQSFDVEELNNQLQKSFPSYGLPLETTVKTERNVKSVMLKFPGLLKELGLSPLASQKLSIKLDVDTNPPEGSQSARTLVNKIYLFNIVHYDMASLYAGKLSACFFRTYIKGRDFYDFLWYMGKRIKPNFLLLNNAIEQTQGINLKITQDNFKEFLLDHISKIDFIVVKKDVERFLEDKGELRIFDPQVIKETIQSVY